MMHDIVSGNTNQTVIIIAAEKALGMIINHLELKIRIRQDHILLCLTAPKSKSTQL